MTFDRTGVSCNLTAVWTSALVAEDNIPRDLSELRLVFFCFEGPGGRDAKEPPKDWPGRWGKEASDHREEGFPWKRHSSPEEHRAGDVV